jgi:type II restriction enzyme
MPQLTASNIVREIARLDVSNYYNYIDNVNQGRIKISRIVHPEGPIYIRRWNPAKGDVEADAKEASISKNMLWRLASSINSGQPFNVDRVLGASYNTRSVLETLLAHTPEFYFCYPGRVEISGSSNPEVKEGHKHLMWLPDNRHSLGTLQEISTNIVISEAPSQDAYIDITTIPAEEIMPTASSVDPALARTHAMMQVFLYNIGKHLGFRTWIAQNDRGIIYQNKQIVEHEGIINKLNLEPLIKSYPDAIHAARLIDCVWFKNGTLMPAVIEVEHSTGVKSGLHRMKTFKDLFPPFPTRYVVVAPDDDKSLVIREANNPIFRDLNTRFFSYSAVNELHNLIQRRKLRGITEEFLDSFMEPVVLN